MVDPLDRDESRDSVRESDVGEAEKVREGGRGTGGVLRGADERKDSLREIVGGEKGEGWRGGTLFK
jgi:hypothetical protein